MSDTLVIACGNSLRSDDGVAHVAAHAIQAWRICDVRVLCVHQLLPELVEEMKSADRILFVDAGLDTGDVAYRVRAMSPHASRRNFGHHETPENLLALLHSVERRQTEAWLLSIRATSFDHGEAITPEARSNAEEALVWIHVFLTADRP